MSVAKRGQLRRPYPYTQGDYSDRHEKHEREPAVDGFPVHSERIQVR